MIAGLDQERRVHHHDGIGLAFAQVTDLAVVGLEHPGVDALVEPGALFGVAEDDVSQFPSVDGTVGQLDGDSEMMHHLAARFLTGR